MHARNALQSEGHIRSAVAYGRGSHAYVALGGRGREMQRVVKKNMACWTTRGQVRKQERGVILSRGTILDAGNVPCQIDWHENDNLFFDNTSTRQRGDTRT